MNVNSYAELHCKTNFSFLEGASHADELVEQAIALGYRALAITDRASLSGIVRAYTAAKDTDFKLIYGVEVECEVPDQESPYSIVLWAPDRQAYGRLARLITVGRRQAPKGECYLTWQNLVDHADGVLAAITPKWKINDIDDSVRQQLKDFRDLFGERSYLLLELLQGDADKQHLIQCQQLSKECDLPLVAAGDVHYHARDRRMLQDVLTAIRHGVPVSEAGEHLFANAERYLRPLSKLQKLYASVPDALMRTMEIAEQCTFQLQELRYEYPEELAPDQRTPFEFLCDLTWRGAKKRYTSGVPDKVRQLLLHELTLIEELQYEAYFLTVWDLVRFARHQGILCQGRGSAANSAVCFCLGVTSVDPDTTDVLFERFVSKERDEAPDIDVDFEHERREEVLQYLYQKYGRDRAGLTAVVITYRSRSAVRDVGKALGLSLDCVDAIAKNVEGYAEEPQLAERCELVGLDPTSPLGQQFIQAVNEIIGFPRHLSQHVGGMVMTRGYLCELAPIENAAMEGRTVLQWDKDDLEELGILKVDCLALGMLSAIRKCFDLIEQHDGQRWNLATVPKEDPEVYDMVCEADTMGVFQIESRAQMSMLPRLRPRSYYDLVIEVAIVRPGPIQGQMVHPYLRRRAGKESVSYPNDEIRQVLHKTLGVPIFQEQAMRLAVVAAGFTPGEADQLRRAMGAWRRPGVIDQFHQKLIRGMKERGLSEQFAEQVFRQIRGFGEYGFPESHAASFALLVYVSAWLKRYHHAAFTASLINSQPMGFYAVAQLVRDARDHHVNVLPVDVNRSKWDCTLERETAEAGKDLSLRLGFRVLSGFSQNAADIIESIRELDLFHSHNDFQNRTKLSKRMMTKLAEADAFQSLGQSRRQALWDALGQDTKARNDQPLLSSMEVDEPCVDLPQMALEEEVTADYLTTGLSLKAHPLSFYRDQLQQLKVVTSAELSKARNNRQIRVAGIVLLRQRPSTAKGITFVTLEDETGTSNLVLHQKIWEQFYPIARRSPAWIAHGRLERQDRVIHVVVNKLEDFSTALGALKTQSRDFR